MTSPTPGYVDLDDKDHEQVVQFLEELHGVLEVHGGPEDRQKMDELKGAIAALHNAKVVEETSTQSSSASQGNDPFTDLGTAPPLHFFSGSPTNRTRREILAPHWNQSIIQPVSWRQLPVSSPLGFSDDDSESLTVGRSRTASVEATSEDTDEPMAEDTQAVQTSDTSETHD